MFHNYQINSPENGHRSKLFGKSVFYLLLAPSLLSEFIYVFIYNELLLYYEFIYIGAQLVPYLELMKLMLNELAKPESIQTMDHLK